MIGCNEYLHIKLFGQIYFYILDTCLHIYCVIDCSLPCGLVERGRTRGMMVVTCVGEDVGGWGRMSLSSRA